MRVSNLSSKSRWTSAIIIATSVLALSATSLYAQGASSAAAPETAAVPTPQPPADGNGVVIDRTFMDLRIPGEPRYVLEFTSVPGRIYTIIYSDDLQSWKAATPSITATANRTQWYDDGAPKTDAKPSAKSVRFYRCVETQ